MVIITLYLCFRPCSEVHQNGYWKLCAAKITKRLKLLFVRDSLDGLALYDDIATGHNHDHIHLDVAFELFSVEKRMIYELLPCIKLFFNQFSAQSLLVDIFRHSGSQLSVDILHTAYNATNRWQMLQPFLKIGRTLFLEGHEALPCTGTTSPLFLLRQNSTIDNQALARIIRWYRGTHAQQGRALCPSSKKCPNRWKISRIRELKEFYLRLYALQNLSNIVLGRAWSPSLHWHDFATFLLGQNSAIDNQAFLTSSMRHPESKISFWKIVTYRLCPRKGESQPAG